MGKISITITLVFLSVSMLGGCAIIPDTGPPIAFDLRAGKVPLGCGTERCKRDRARYHDRLAIEERKAWEDAARNREYVERVYNARIPYNQFRTCVARCYVLSGATEAQCATACRDAVEQRNAKVEKLYKHIMRD